MESIPSPDAISMDSEAIDLYTAVLRGQWRLVIDMYNEDSRTRTTKLRYTNGYTALHLAVLEAKDDDVKHLMDTIKNQPEDQLGKIVDDNGETPLHLAASRGLLKKCQYIAPAAPCWLSARNDDGESPLFLSALHGHELVFLYLASVCHDLSICRRTYDGNTVLHVTIDREYFDLAYSIIHIFEDLVASINSDGASPLHFLANKPSAFRSSTHLRWWQSIIYHTITIDPLMFIVKTKFTDPEQCKEKIPNFPENYTSCYDFFVMVDNIFKKAFKQESSVKAGNPDLEGQIYALRSKHQYPQNYATCMEFLSGSFMYILGQSGFGEEFTRLKRKKLQHIWSLLITEKLMTGNLISSSTGDGSQPFPVVLPTDEELKTSGESSLPTPSEIKYAEKKERQSSTSQRTWDSPVLLAAKNGVVELLQKILKLTPVAVHDMTADEKTVLLSAVENRHPKILETFVEKEVFQRLVQRVDKYGNTVLHYAAMSSGRRPWRIPGAALQMQWEIKWYEYVKSHVPLHFVFRANSTGKTPAVIFNDDHKRLVSSGGEWLNSTAKSCSVVAALIATVAFTTSTQVPGGTTAGTGKPNLEGQPAFNLFAFASLVSLGFSVTSLIMFLAILTSRYQTRDFHRDLPVKLFLGLSSLFVSITSGLVSFCAGHFFEVKDRFGNAVFPIYLVTCLPITFYAVAQFPLYVDLWKAIHIDVPQPSWSAEDF